MCREKMYLITTFILLLCFIHLTKAAFLRCYQGTLENYLVAPLDEPLKIWPCLDTTLPTVMYVFGYKGKVLGPATTAVISAYVARKKENVVLLDWEEEAKSGSLGIPLGYVLYAVPNAKKIGVKLGEALIQLEKSGLNMTYMHLVGHSLGAHVMAFAGKYAREKGHVVSRITGLDPARALFEGAFAIKAGLDRTCAKFVDIIHTDPGGYGYNSSAGTVDFWPNQAGKGGKQNGCPVGDFEMFSSDDLCNHDRSWRYFAEALYSPTSFPAIFANSYEEWLANGDSISNQIIYLGELTSTQAKGNYYLTTNPTSPYGKGMEGLTPVDTHTSTGRTSTLSRFLKKMKKSEFLKYF